MKDILAKILYIILALVVLICLFIGLSAVNPDIAKPLTEIAADIVIGIILLGVCPYIVTVLGKNTYHIF